MFLKHKLNTKRSLEGSITRITFNASTEAMKVFRGITGLSDQQTRYHHLNPGTEQKWDVSGYSFTFDFELGVNCPDNGDERLVLMEGTLTLLEDASMVARGEVRFSNQRPVISKDIGRKGPELMFTDDLATYTLDQDSGSFKKLVITNSDRLRSLPGVIYLDRNGERSFMAV